MNSTLILSPSFVLILGKEKKRSIFFTLIIMCYKYLVSENK